MTPSLEQYRNAFIAALFLHAILAFMLLVDSMHTRAVLNPAPQSEARMEQQAIKAVSVDSDEVMKTVNQLKEQRLQEQQQEARRQQQLQQKAQLAEQKRREEQKRLQEMKQETEKLAKAREQALLEEQQRMKQLAKQREQETQRLALLKKEQQEIQKQRQEEALKLAALQKKKQEALEKVHQEQLKEEQLKQRKAKEAQAAVDAAKQVHVAGEVDKYKALIINAISRQWILPDNADSSKSSQFRIRLAPNGVVLEVSLTRSSGDPILDRSAQSAIYKASPLPVPSDPDTFNLFRDISLTVRPETVRG